MKATTLLISGRYEVTGLHPIVGTNQYEMQYSYAFGSKSYKTKENAIKAIQKKGYEYVETTRDQLVASFD